MDIHALVHTFISLLTHTFIFAFGHTCPYAHEFENKLIMLRSFEVVDSYNLPFVLVMCPDVDFDFGLSFDTTMLVGAY